MKVVLSVTSFVKSGDNTESRQVLRLLLTTVEQTAIPMALPRFCRNKPNAVTDAEQKEMIVRSNQYQIEFSKLRTQVTSIASRLNGYIAACKDHTSSCTENSQEPVKHCIRCGVCHQGKKTNTSRDKRCSTHEAEKERLLVKTPKLTSRLRTILYSHWLVSIETAHSPSHKCSYRANCSLTNNETHARHHC